MSIAMLLMPRIRKMWSIPTVATNAMRLKPFKLRSSPQLANLQIMYFLPIALEKLVAILFSVSVTKKEVFMAVARKGGDLPGNLGVRVTSLPPSLSSLPLPFHYVPFSFFPLRFLPHASSLHPSFPASKTRVRFLCLHAIWCGLKKVTL